jgi:hypothetical protein
VQARAVRGPAVRGAPASLAGSSRLGMVAGRDHYDRWSAGGEDRGEPLLGEVDSSRMCRPTSPEAGCPRVRASRHAPRPGQPLLLRWAGGMRWLPGTIRSTAPCGSECPGSDHPDTLQGREVVVLERPHLRGDVEVRAVGAQRERYGDVRRAGVADSRGARRYQCPTGRPAKLIGMQSADTALNVWELRSGRAGLTAGRQNAARGVRLIERPADAVSPGQPR